MSRRIVLSTIGAVALAALVFVGGASAAKAPHVRSVSGKSLVQTRFLDVTGMAAAGSQAPTDAFCRANLGVPCYSPQEIRHAYGVDQLLTRGDQGKGQTIVIIDSFGSPTIASDLQTFDSGYGLPDPPSFRVIAPLGTVPFDPSAIPDQVGWAFETTLDVEWAHAMAPKASIVLLTSPVDETEGVQGMPQFDELINYALDHHLGRRYLRELGSNREHTVHSRRRTGHPELQRQLCPRRGDGRHRACLNGRQRCRQRRDRRGDGLPVPDGELPRILAARRRNRRDQPDRRHEWRLPVGDRMERRWRWHQPTIP